MQASNVEQEILSAVCEKLNICLNDPEVSEIGDGNINRVFRVKDGKLSVVVKYAPASTVILPTIKLRRSRGLREAEYLSLCGKISKGTVPKVYGYDKDRYVLIIEDMGKVQNVSEAFINGDDELFDAEKLAGFTADTCFYTSIYADDPLYKVDDGFFDFNDLCMLTQELVFEQPYEDHPNNHFSECNRELVNKLVYKNDILKQKVSCLKDSFLNCHQAVIHGDLHLASVFASENLKVFDGEFAYCGPIGFDPGNVIAHLLMTCLRRSVLSKMRNKSLDTLRIENYVYEYINCFEKRFSDLLSCYGKEECMPSDKVVGGIMKDAYGFAGVECLRRVIGLAKSPLFTKSVTEDERALIERCLIFAGISLIIDDISFSCCEDVYTFCNRIFNEGMKMT